MLDLSEFATTILNFVSVEPWLVQPEQPKVPMPSNIFDEKGIATDTPRDVLVKQPIRGVQDLKTATGPRPDISEPSDTLSLKSSLRKSNKDRKVKYFSLGDQVAQELERRNARLANQGRGRAASSSMKSSTSTSRSTKSTVSFDESCYSNSVKSSVASIDRSDSNSAKSSVASIDRLDFNSVKSSVASIDRSAVDCDARNWFKLNSVSGHSEWAYEMQKQRVVKAEYCYRQQLKQRQHILEDICKFKSMQSSQPTHLKLRDVDYKTLLQRKLDSFAQKDQAVRMARRDLSRLKDDLGKDVKSGIADFRRSPP